MQYNLKLFIFMIMAITTLNLKNNLQAEKYQKPSIISLGAHYSLLDSPNNASDSIQNLFTDYGAWFGFALPDNDRGKNFQGSSPDQSWHFPRSESLRETELACQYLLCLLF